MMYLQSYAELRGDRIGEITLQTGDLLSFFGAAFHLDSGQRKRSLELLTVVQLAAYNVELQIKHFLRTPRPIDFSPNVQPIIQTPDHSSFPSGHATEAFALATVLHWLAEGQRSHAITAGPLPMAFRLAHRIAVNRTVAGVHFPVDSAAGALLGCAIGEAVIGLGSGEKIANVELGYDGVTTPHRPVFEAQRDFDQNWIKNALGRTAMNRVESDDLLSGLVGAAKAEWPGVTHAA